MIRINKKMLGATEVIIIAIVAAVILFGGKKINDIGRSLGRFSAEFQKGKIEAEKELKEIKDEFEKMKDEVPSTKEDQK